MMNRVQIGYPAIMKAVEKPPTIEIGMKKRILLKITVQYFKINFIF